VRGGRFSPAGCVLLAWLTGRIRYAAAAAAPGGGVGGWVDAATGAAVTGLEVKARYEEALLARRHPRHRAAPLRRLRPLAQGLLPLRRARPGPGVLGGGARGGRGGRVCRSAGARPSSYVGLGRPRGTYACAAARRSPCRARPPLTAGWLASSPLVSTRAVWGSPQTSAAWVDPDGTSSRSPRRRRRCSARACPTPTSSSPSCTSAPSATRRGAAWAACSRWRRVRARVR